jgi:hypothetical protein
MSNVVSVAGCVALTLVSALLVTSQVGEEPQAVAQNLGPFPDADDDFLPDAVEWVLLTDPDSADTDDDGAIDYIDALGFSQRDPLVAPSLADHSARFVAASSIDDAGRRKIWLFLLMHVVGGNPSSIESFDVFVESNGVSVSLLPILGTGQIYSRSFSDPLNEHLFAIYAFELLDEQISNHLQPLCLGASITLDGLNFTNDLPVFEAEGVMSTLADFGDGRVAVQTLGGDTPVQSVWTNNRICTLDIVPITTTLYQVFRSGCETFEGLYCPPGCRNLTGRTFTLPGGLGAVTGH